MLSLFSFFFFLVFFSLLFENFLFLSPPLLLVFPLFPPLRLFLFQFASLSPYSFISFERFVILIYGLFLLFCSKNTFCSIIWFYVWGVNNMACSCSGVAVLFFFLSIFIFLLFLQFLLLLFCFFFPSFFLLLFFFVPSSFSLISFSFSLFGMVVVVVMVSPIFLFLLFNYFSNLRGRVDISLLLSH